MIHLEGLICDTDEKTISNDQIVQFGSLHKVTCIACKRYVVSFLRQYRSATRQKLIDWEGDVHAADGKTTEIRQRRGPNYAG